MIDKSEATAKAFSGFLTESFGLFGLFILIAWFTFPSTQKPVASGEGGAASTPAELTPEQLLKKERAEKIKAALEMAKKLKDVKKDAMEVKDKPNAQSEANEKAFSEMEQPAP